MQQLPPLDTRVRAAWQTQVAAAVNTPGLLPAVAQRRQQQLPRFAACYPQLRALPRRVRRALQRQWKQSLAGIALLLALGQGQTLAATLNVSGGCTLLDAITAANTDAATGGCSAGSGADTLILQNSSAHTLTTVNNSTYGPTGLPVISSQITIEGHNSTIERDSGAPNFRIFAVNSSGDLTLQETTVSGGGEASGGGVFNFGTVTIQNSTLSGNTTSISGSGGGVFNSGGTVTIQDSTLSGNRAGDSGGGVFNSGGTVTIQDSTLSGNAGFESSGGVFNSGGIVTIQNSTLSGNAGFHSGGGVLNSGGIVTIQNSTLSGNSVHPGFGSGGGVWNSGTVTIQNSTLSGNSASYGGGVSNYGGTLTLVRTLVSGNTAPTGPEIDNFPNGTVTADNYNLSGHDGNAGVAGFTPGATDVVPAEPLTDILDPTLADNGGPTFTHALVPDSPALDASPADANCPPTDQRGVPRPQGSACDIGAFELEASMRVGLDIKPGTSPNPINLKSKGVIPLAILSTATFDATTVDPSTVCFGDAEDATQRDCTEAHGKGHIEDVDGDGDLDLVLHYRTQQTGIDPGDTQACLTGETFEGIAIEGCDSVQTQ